MYLSFSSWERAQLFSPRENKSHVSAFFYYHIAPKVPQSLRPIGPTPFNPEKEISFLREYVRFIPYRVKLIAFQSLCTQYQIASVQQSFLFPSFFPITAYFLLALPSGVSPVTHLLISSHFNKGWTACLPIFQTPLHFFPGIICAWDSVLYLDHFHLAFPRSTVRNPEASVTKGKVRNPDHIPKRHSRLSRPCYIMNII